MKPPFHIPSVAEIRDTPWNGLTHVSTFSGCGGTCLGFRMAGFKTLLANDIDEHARECYERNLRTPIDGEDIRKLTAADVLTRIGLQRGELDVFEGSPPCTNFSTAGRGAKGWNKTKKHAGVVQADTEKLFLAWLDLLDGLRPRAFAAENVTGLIKGASKGYFREILARMKSLGYRVEARVLDAQWLGVPQQRERVIFVGVRENLGIEPPFPKPLPYRYGVRDALPWVRRVERYNYGFAERSADLPIPTIMANSGQRWTGYGDGVARELTADELKVLGSFPCDFDLGDSQAKGIKRVGNSVPPLMARAIASSLAEVLR